MPPTNLSPHDFSSISPSAYALLAMKSMTSIPYAREAAALFPQVEKFTPDFAAFKEEYWNRILHFENRYWSIDQLMTGIPVTNILELSSGFSFRGLALSRERTVYYIDTDLPGVIAGKQRFVDALISAADQQPGDQMTAGRIPVGESADQQPGRYELQPLNVLDASAFDALVERFPAGPLTIVNEGLLMYLDLPEKEQLCQNIRNILLRRGGCWITADIYIKKPEGEPPLDTSDSFRRWTELHKIEEKKFSDFHAAADFFSEMGFTIDEQAKPDYSRLTALEHLRRAAGQEAIDRLRGPRRTRQHATWRLKLKG